MDVKGSISPSSTSTQVRTEDDLAEKEHNARRGMDGVSRIRARIRNHFRFFHCIACHLFRRSKKSTGRCESREGGILDKKERAGIRDNKSTS